MRRRIRTCGRVVLAYEADHGLALEEGACEVHFCAEWEMCCGEPGETVEE